MFERSFISAQNYEQKVLIFFSQNIHNWYKSAERIYSTSPND